MTIKNDSYVTYGSFLLHTSHPSKQGSRPKQKKKVKILLRYHIKLISINQIDLCHTSNISSKGWFIHLFEKEIK